MKHCIQSVELTTCGLNNGGYHFVIIFDMFFASFPVITAIHLLLISLEAVQAVAITCALHAVMSYGVDSNLEEKKQVLLRKHHTQESEFFPIHRIMKASINYPIGLLVKMKVFLAHIQKGVDVGLVYLL